MTMPALVFLCQRIPYPPIKGERITSFNLLRHLTRRFRVFLGTFIDDPADRGGIEFLRNMVEDLHVGDISGRLSWLELLPRWIAGEPASFGRFRSAALARWLDDVERLHRPVAVVTHSSNISTYAVDRFRRKQSAEPRRVLHFADVDSEKFVAYAERARGIRRWIYSLEARRVRREEFRLAAGADATAFVSDEEAALFRSLLAGRQGRVVTLPNGVDTEIFDPGRYPTAPIECRGAVFIFTGAMDYLPNVEAVEWFATAIFPRIRNALPHAQFLIVGAKPTEVVRALARIPGVEVTGRVDSVAAYLAHAQVVVAPLRIARGVQNKVLEAMSMGRAVVATTGALTGIGALPGVHALCAETPAEWTEACTHLVKEPQLANRIGAAGRELILRHFSWQAQFDRLDALLA